MFRRIVSTVALIGFVASQLALIPHAHAGLSPTERREHDAKAHVHTGLGHHHHGHSHSHSGHQHGDRREIIPRTSDESGGNEIFGFIVQHDTDAVYIANDTSICAAGTNTSNFAASGLALIAFDSFTLSPQGFREAISSFHPPDANITGVKLFLKLRNLRI